MGAISTFDLQEIIDRFNTTVFIETGTLYGDGITYALKYNFDIIISIEIDKNLAEQAQNRFRSNSNVHIIHGDSKVVLQNILPTINGNILFWLDAHFPGADSGQTTYESCLSLPYNDRLPLEAELNIIKQSRLNKDVMICDDLWIYKDGTYGAGNIDDHAKRHNQNVTKLQISEGKDISFVSTLYGDTHTFKEVYNHQGYLIILPKL